MDPLAAQAGPEALVAPEVRVAPEARVRLVDLQAGRAAPEELAAQVVRAELVRPAGQVVLAGLVALVEAEGQVASGLLSTPISQPIHGFVRLASRRLRLNVGAVAAVAAAEITSAAEWAVAAAAAARIQKTRR